MKKALAWLCLLPFISLMASKKISLKRKASEQELFFAAMDLEDESGKLICKFCGAAYKQERDYTRHVICEAVNSLLDIKYGKGCHEKVYVSDKRIRALNGEPPLKKHCPKHR